MANPLVNVSLGDIEEALFRAGACRFECSSLAGSIIDSDSIQNLQESMLLRRGVFPDILAKELRAFGLVVRWTDKRTGQFERASKHVH